MGFGGSKEKSRIINPTQRVKNITRQVNSRITNPTQLGVS